MDSIHIAPTSGRATVRGPEAVVTQEAHAQTPRRGIAGVARAVFYVLAALLPLWVMPFSVDVQFGREVLFSVLVLGGVLLWLVSVLMEGRVRSIRSPVLYAAVLLLGVWALATALAPSFIHSAVLAEASAERLSTLLLGVLAIFAIGGVFRERSQVRNFLLVFLLASGVAGLISALQFLFQVSLFKLFVPFASGVDFNAIGTVNGLAVFYAVLLGMTAAVFGTGWAEGSGKGESGWVRPALVGIAAIFLLNLVLIHFRISWVILLITGIAGFALRLQRSGAGVSADGVSGHERRFRAMGASGLLFIVLIAFSAACMMTSVPLFKEIPFPAEVSPSFSATRTIISEVWGGGAKGIFLGSGPGTFGLDWERYKPAAINQTFAWNARFDQGFSWAATIPATAGIAGTGAFFLLLLAGLVLFARGVVLQGGEDRGETALALFIGFFGIVLASILYPATFTFAIFLFLLLGILPVALVGSDSRVFREKEFAFTGSWTVFASSLAAIFLLALGIAGMYGQFGRLRAALAVNEANEHSGKGEFAPAAEAFARAIRAEEYNYRHHRDLARINTEQVRGLIARASGGENVQQEFQQTVGLGVRNIQRAVELNGEEPSVHQAQGALYELVIPFIDGVERFAFSSYEQAIARAPQNPALHIDLGRSLLVFADRLSRAVVSPDADRAELQKRYLETLERARGEFARAAELKADLAVAHFLLAQTAMRQGNAAGAIQGIENARAAAPGDIGLAFQLGVLYYQSGQFDKAEQQFINAVSLNKDYSNARYFLGLIMDRKGNREGAIAQFTEIERHNPLNLEVKRILENLRAGRIALDGITPPPEQRTEVPIKEGENAAGTATSTPARP